MADQFRTVNVPTVGPVNFPVDMGDDQVRDAIYKNYPHLAPENWQSQHPAGLGMDQLPGVPKPQSMLDALPDQKQMEVLRQKANSPLASMPLPGFMKPKSVKDAQSAYKQALMLGAGGDNPISVGAETLADQYQKVAQRPLIPSAIQGALTMGHDFNPAPVQKSIDSALAPSTVEPGAPLPSPTAERAKAVGRWAVHTAEGLSTPENLGLMGAMALAPESAESTGAKVLSNLKRGAGAAFGVQMGNEGLQSIPDTVKKLWKGRPGEGLEAGLNTVTNLGLGALGTREAFSEPRPVAERPVEAPQPTTPSGVAPAAVGAEPTPTTAGGAARPVIKKKVFVAKPQEAATPPAEVSPIPETSAQPSAPRTQALSEAQTGQPFTGTLWHGSGRDSKTSPYGEGAISGTPILGDARYTTPEPEHAKAFGPQVDQVQVSLKNPLVINNDAQWRSLAKEAGWEFPNPVRFDPDKADLQRNEIASMRDMLEKKGYDGVIVHIPKFRSGGVDMVDERVGKTLDRVFGGDQVVEFGSKKEAPTPAPEATPQATNPSHLPLTDDAKKKVADLALRRVNNGKPVFNPDWDKTPEGLKQKQAMQQVLDEVLGKVNLNKLNAVHLKALDNYSKTGQTLAEAIAVAKAKKSGEPIQAGPEDLPTQEGKLRGLVGSLVKTRQLQKAAQDRLSVELALKEDSADMPIPNQYQEAVTKIIGISRDDFLKQGDRLTPDQRATLEAQMAAGRKAVTLPEDHPERAFGENGIHPLAKINEESLRAAGVPSPKDTYSMLTPKEKAELQRFKKTGGVQSVDSSHTLQAGLGGGRDTVSRGRDADTLEAEHKYAQMSLDRRLRATRKEIEDRLPKWIEARRAEKEPSPLSQDIAQLSGNTKKSIPAQLHAYEHLIAKTATSAESTPAPEPVAPAKGPKKGTATKGTPSAKESQDRDAVRSGISGAAQDIYDQHGEDAFNKIKDIADAVGAKFKKPENHDQVLYSALGAYMKNLDAGIENAHQPILDKLNSMPPEGNATFHANPIPSTTKPTPIPAPRGAAAKLPNEAMEHFVSKMERSQGAGLDEHTKAFFNTETRKVADYLQSVPEVSKATFGHVQDMMKATWKAYSERPGNSPMDYALGWRRWELSVNALTTLKFTSEIRRLHPDPARREAMVNYLQAGGGIDPEHIVQADLQLKANSFGQGRTDIKRLKQGYLDAMDLTPSEKKTISDYRAYDKEMSDKEEALGLTLHRQANYIRQIWSPDSLASKSIEGVVHAAPFATTGQFEKMRKYENYFEGEMDGLMPHRKDFGYLVSARARAGAEVLANRNLVDRLYKMKTDKGEPVAVVAGAGYGDPEINPGPDAVRGAVLIKGSARTQKGVTEEGVPYAVINHPAFQSWKWVKTIERGFGDDGAELPPVDALYKGNMLVHPEMATQLKRILEPSSIRNTAPGRALLRVSNIGKQTLLVGLFHPMQLGVHFLEHAGEGGTSSHTLNAVNPFSKSVINLDDFVQQQLVIHGLKVADYNAEGMWDEGVMTKGFANAAPYLGAGLRALHDAMFQKYIPNIKMAMALDAIERNNKRYLSNYTDKELALQKQQGYSNFAEAARNAQSRIYRMTSDQMNAAFGGINWDKMPINKTGQDVLRLMVLAPDFLIARGQFVADALRPGGMESLKALGVGAVLQYFGARAFNDAMNDGDPKWNIKDWNKFIHGHEEYNLRTVQGDVTDAAFDWRRFISHRLNPVFARPLFELGTQHDVYGNPTTAGQQLFDFAQNVVPMPLQGVYQAMESHLAKKEGWNLRRQRDTDEHIADTILQSMTGLQRHTYRSPAERYVFQKFQDTKAGPTDDALALEQKATFNDLRDAFRKGELKPKDLQDGLRSGKLKESAVRYLFKTSQHTQLYNHANQLPIGQVMDAWKLGTQSEKLDLVPLVLKKLKTLPPEQQATVGRAMSDWVNKLPPQDRAKAIQTARGEIQWEQEQQKK